MPTNHYDLIVQGDDLAGVIAGALCSRRGLRVLVAEAPLERLPGRFARAALPLVGESSPAVRRVVAELGCVQLFRQQLTPHRPTFVVLFEDGGADGRVTVTGEGGFLAAEAAAFLPQAQAASRLLEPVLGQDVALPPNGFWERREIARSDSRLPGEDMLPTSARARTVVSLPAAFALACDPRRLTPMAVARSFELWRQSATRVESRAALRRLLVDELRRQGGELLPLASARLVRRSASTQGLVLAKETLGFGQLLWAAPIDALAAAVPRTQKRLTALAMAVRPTAQRIAINVAVTGGAETLAPLTFVVRDPRAPLLDDNALALIVAPADEHGRILLTVLANSTGAIDDKLVLARLREVLPMLQLGEHQTTPPEPLWSSTLPPALGVGALPYQVGIKSIATASNQNLLGLGLEGSFAAGWCAARIITSAADVRGLGDAVLLGTS